MKDTRISWCDHTFNAWIGCTKVNEACKFCYAEAHDNRFYKETHWGAGSNRLLTSNKYWNQPINWNRAAGNAKIQQRVFTSSLADVFEDHNQVKEWRTKLFELIEKTPNLIWMVLTKRPQNILQMVPDHWLKTGVPVNVRFGLSIGNQTHFVTMWPIMENAMYELKARHFLSIEPLIGAVDLLAYQDCVKNREAILPEYVIVGGESGPKARPMHPEWAEKIMLDCAFLGISFHFKQWGEWQNGSEPLSKYNMIVLTNGQLIENTTAGLRSAKLKYTAQEWANLKPTIMCKVGKERSGDVLNDMRYKALIK